MLHSIIAICVGDRRVPAFRALASFGHHHTLHDIKFFEVMSPLGIMLEFVVSAAEAEQLKDLVSREGIRTLCAVVPVDFEVLNPEAEERATRLSS